LLALLALNILTITCQRLYIYFSAKRQTRYFLRDSTAALHDGRIEEVVAIAARTPRSPTAAVVTEGVHAFVSTPPQLTERQAIYAAERACRRVRGAVTAELAKGLETLRTVASLAPFVGLGGTCVGILNSFREIGMQKDAARSMIASLIAEALVITAFGLCVAILAVWFHNYLSRRVEILVSEMLQAEATILQSFKAHPAWRDVRGHTVGTSRWAFLTLETPRWEVSYDRQRPLLVAVWGCAIFLVIVLLLSSTWFTG
jgi:biopolymer transport protein ExbB/TolQ